MILAADVKNIKGTLLLGEGATLTERHIRMLKMWGIETANIAGEPEPDEAKPALEVTPEIIQMAEKQIAHRFRLIQMNSPVLVELRKLALQRSIHQLSEQSAPPPAPYERP
jgi:hypothetical protein